MVRIIGLLILILYVNISFGQQRISINGIDLIDAKSKGFFKNMMQGDESYVLTNVPRFCLNFFANNKNFIAVDRQNLTLISQERELQKSEDFIDGYMVEQGRSEGVDLILKSFYYQDKKVLNIRIYDVNQGELKCSIEKKLASNLFGVKKIEKQVTFMIHDLMYDCFDVKYKVVRQLNKDTKKAKELLVAIGSKSIVRKGDKLNVIQLIEEDIDGVILNRTEIIGEVEVEKILDKNFSETRVKKGHKEIALALKNGQKIYGLIKNEYDKQ